MRFGWFDYHWPWIGLAMSAALMVLLFGTNWLRGDTTRSRWRDPVWLAWLAPASYMIHQCEEYGLNALGQHFAFPDLLCSSVHLPPYPACNLPTAVFLAINLPIVWFGGLLGAIFARRFRVFGLTLYGVHFVNSLSHIGTWIASGQYNSGALTACLILLPLSLWVGFILIRDKQIRWTDAAGIVLASVVLHGILLGAIQAFVHGLVNGPILVITEALNAAWYFGLFWLRDLFRRARSAIEP